MFSIRILRALNRVRAIAALVVAALLSLSAARADVLFQENWQSGAIDTAKWSREGTGHFVFDLGLTGQGPPGDFALFLRDPSFTSASGIRSMLGFNRSQELTASFKLMSDQSGVLSFAGIGGPWSNAAAPAGTYPVLQQIEAGISREENGSTYYVEGAPSNWATTPMTPAFRSAFMNATTKANAVDVSVTLGTSSGAKIAWSVGGGPVTVEFNTLGQTAGTNWGGANVVSSTDPVRLFFGGVGNGTTHRAAIVDDIVVTNANSGSIYLTDDDFEVAGLPQQQYNLNAVYSNAQLDRIDVAGSVGYVIKPTANIDADRRWVWLAPLWLALPSAHGSYIARDYVQSLLDQGYHVAGFDVGVSLGSPVGAELFEQFHDHVVDEYGLNPKARMLAVSNGGLIAYGYAFRNPENVDRIAGIYPALDFTSWPGINLVAGPSAMTPVGVAYDLTLSELLAQIEQYNPINNLQPLAASSIPLWHIHGDADPVVPITPNSLAAVERYDQLGGDIELMIVPGGVHGGTGFFTSVELIDFLTAPSVARQAGDYDRDGAVTTADYVVWRKHLGSSFHLFGNGDGMGLSSGLVDQADYLLWNRSFGHSIVGISAALEVPEPNSVVFFLMATYGMLNGMFCRQIPRATASERLLCA